MKKVVLVSDGNNFSTKAFDFVKALYEQEPFLLTGAFFRSVNYGMLIKTTFSTNAGPYLKFVKEEQQAYEKGIDKFDKLCEHNHIEHVVHQESEEWHIDDLIKESRFADVLVVSANLFFAGIQEEKPSRFLRDILVNSECPVLVVPEVVQPIENIAIAYDGKKESMFALKMFCYTFPHLTKLPVNIYHWVNHSDDDIPDFELLQEFAGRHFDNLNFRELFFDHTKYLSTWVNDYKNTMFVCGSYHRAGLSSLFRKNFAEDIIKKQTVPVFIAHN